MWAAQHLPRGHGTIGQPLNVIDGEICVMDRRTAEQALIDGLLHDVAAHEAGRYDLIGTHFETVEAMFAEATGRSDKDVNMAYDFWDCWIDARNHDWRYYEPIQNADWPSLARHIIQALTDKRSITDPLVLEQFTFTHQPLTQRIGAFFKRLIS
jgi:hypothetical protein